MKRVVVIGGGGFLGSHVVEALRRRGCASIAVPRRADADLRDREAIRRLFDATRPTMVIHLAATVGGIGANSAEPGRFFYDNAVMGIEIVEAARRHGMTRLRRPRSAHSGEIVRSRRDRQAPEAIEMRKNRRIAAALRRRAPTPWAP